MGEESMYPPVLLVTCAAGLVACGGARADAAFDVEVARPAFVSRHPVLVIDEAHRNVHTTSGRFAPFARLVASDGYAVRANRAPFTAAGLADAQVLVIANPMGQPNKASPAFTEAECDAVQAWVAAGGALLLVTDHAPIGSATEVLARRFGVDMGKGEVQDRNHAAPGRDPAQLVFARVDGLLGIHAILDGRSAAERIDRVMTFTGQSLRGPDDSAALLLLSDSAVDLPLESVAFEPGWLSDTLKMTLGDPVPAKGRSQALAMTYGHGRIVVTGEAAMLTAQVLDGQKFGMNVPGIDNRQFALNIVHWLSGVLP
jgi:hypothetical protein